jgi:competence protein ComEA
MRKVTAILLMMLFLTGVLVTAPLAAGKVKDSEKVNINRATISQLYGLPGMTEPLAKAIVAYIIEEEVRFETVNDLLKVPGMTKEYLDKIAPYIIILPEGDDISLPKY